MITEWKRRYIFILLMVVVFVLPSMVSGQIQLPEGTEVTVAFSQEVSSKFVKPGDQVAIKLVNPLEVGGVTLVKAGATGTALIKTVEKAGKGGKGGKLEIELVSLEPKGNYQALEDKKILLKFAGSENGVLGAKGGGKKLLSYLFIAGLFIKGGEAKFAPDKPIKAVTTESVFVVPAG